MVKPLKSEEARDAVLSAFNLLRIYRSSDAVGVLVDYLSARVAYIQSVAIDVSETERIHLKVECNLCNGLLNALNTDSDGPLLII